MKILITGANGFIGKHLVEKLSQIHEIIGIDQNESTLNGKKIWPLDLLNQSDVVAFLKNCEIDVIVHLAAKVPSSFMSLEAQESYELNLAMTKNTLEAFKKYAIKQYIYTSSMSVYGDNIAGEITEETPVQLANPYSKGKYEGEKLAESYGSETQKVTILRIAAPYGLGLSDHTLISKFVKKAQQNEDLTIFGTGSRSQDFINVADVCKAINCSITEKVSGVFNIASGQTTSVNDLAKMILELLPQSNSKIIFTGEIDNQEGYKPKINVKKAEKILKFKAKVTLRDGLKELMS